MEVLLTLTLEDVWTVHLSQMKMAIIISVQREGEQAAQLVSRADLVPKNDLVSEKTIFSEATCI